MGPAGTGKTYLATALAVEALKHHQMRKIVLVRPAVEGGVDRLPHARLGVRRLRLDAGADQGADPRFDAGGGMAVIAGQIPGAAGQRLRVLVKDGLLRIRDRTAKAVTNRVRRPVFELVEMETA